MPTCPRCRRTLREGLRFCTFCGSPVTPRSDLSSAKSPTTNIIEEGKVKEKLANYICAQCGKFANFYCPDHGVFCKHCTSKTISYCPSCGVGFHSAPNDAKCQTILHSVCPVCGKQLVFGPFQKDYKVTCVACGWDSSQNKPKIVEDSLADIFNALNKKKLIQNGAHPILCNRNLVRTGCPVCNHMGLPILRVLPSINVETVEAIKEGNKLSLTLTIQAKLTSQLNLRFPALNKDFSVALNKDETKKINLELQTGKPGVMATRAFATLTAGNFPPLNTEVNLSPVFVLPNIEIEREVKALYIGHEGRISIDIRNRSDFDLEYIEVYNELPKEFVVKEDGFGRKIERIRPGTYKAVDLNVRPTVGGLYHLEPTKILFNVPAVFKSQRVAIFSAPLNIEVGRAYMDIIDPTAAAAMGITNVQPTGMIVKERIIEKKEEVILIKTVPTECPECGAPLSEESVDWVGPEKFKCPTCGSVLNMILERQKNV